jgi:hypothetical protein
LASLDDRHGLLTRIGAPLQIIGSHRPFWVMQCGMTLASGAGGQTTGGAYIRRDATARVWPRQASIASRDFRSNPSALIPANVKPDARACAKCDSPAASLNIASSR